MGSPPGVLGRGLRRRARTEERSMKLAKWSLALVAATGLVFVASASTPMSQDSGKKGTPTEQSKEKEAKAKEAAMKAREERRAAFMKALPTLKTPLSEAIALAEKETKGKAHAAEVELGKDGKLTIEVELLVGEAFQEALVDPDTKKVTLDADEDDDDEDDGEDEDEGDEEDDD
jgi:hypothetical protein